MGNKGRRSVFARSCESAEARPSSDEVGSCRTGGTVVGRGPVSWLSVVVDRPEITAIWNEPRINWVAVLPGRLSRFSGSAATSKQSVRWQPP
jgi:hypothetical protein